LTYEEYPQDYYTDNQPILMKTNLKQSMSHPHQNKEVKYGRLTSKGTENARLYIQMKQTQMKQYNFECLISKVESKIKNVTRGKELNQELEAEICERIKDIDRKLARISLETENGIKRRGRHKWYPDIIQCNREYIALQYERRKLKKSGTKEEFKRIKEESGG
jgi:hypothetical protein